MKIVIKNSWAGIVLLSFGMLLTMEKPSSAELPTKVLMTSKEGLVEPFDVDLDPAGNIYVIDYKGHQLWSLDTKGEVKLLAGTGKAEYSGDGGPGTSASFKSPHVLEVMKDGNIIIADTFNSAVRLYDAKTGKVTGLAGTGKAGFSGDGGPASEAMFNETYHLCLNADETKLLVTDLKNKRLREIDLKSGVVTTVAGTGKGGFAANGAIAKESTLNDPRAAVYGWDGEIYMIDRGGHLLQKIGKDGKLTTLAGEKGVKGTHDGDGKSSNMNGPKDLCIAGDETIFIADTENHVVREYNVRTDMMKTLAVSGMKRPHGVYYRDGKLYIADSERGRVLMVDIEAK